MLKKSGYFAILCIACMLTPCAAQSDASGDEGVNPTMTRNATRGLIFTNSAETMGGGRLSFSFIQTWYKQDSGYSAMPNSGATPNSGANIYTTLGALSFGVNQFIDIFASGAVFTTRQYTGLPRSGIGSVLAGIQGALPFPGSSPFHLGALGTVSAGTSGNQIDSNRADGYDYFDTRTGYDFMGKLLESLVFGNESQSVKLHFNEGAVFSVESEKKTFIMFAMGLQINPHKMVSIGVEFNSRSTWSDNSTISSDPMWLTPSVQFRTPYYMNILLGADISLSSARSDPGAPPALEKYRVFGGLDFTFDLLSGERKAQREKEKNAAKEKENMTKDQIRLRAEADSMARKAKTDSLNLTRKMRADSVAAAQAAKQLADSLAIKMKQDSATLAETKRRLQEEMSKRSDAEKQLLSTGMLLLDAVYFETGRTEISINSKPYLNIIGKMLTKYPKLMIEVSGHTDNIGGYESNRRLSTARAESVRQYLFLVAPELATHLTAVGYGPDNPKADNRTAAGRKVNRRVELQVLNKEVLKEYNP
jgi:outer membrane protein OmpA-like peptidoglycan-associated protein